MKLLQIRLSDNNQLKFISDNIEIIIIVGAILFVAACLLSIIRSTKQDEEMESILVNWEKDNKDIFKGSINLIGGGNFLNVKEFTINGFFYELEDRFISTDGKAYYKNAIESTDLISVDNITKNMSSEDLHRVIDQRKEWETEDEA